MPAVKCNLNSFTEDITRQMKEGLFDYLMQNYKVKNNDELIEYIIKNRNSIPKCKDLLQGGYRNSDLVKKELLAGEDPSKQNHNGDTILHLMCCLKKKEYDRKLIRWICEKCPKIKSIENKNEDTPYGLAKKKKKHDLLYILGNQLLFTLLLLLF